MKKLLLTLLVVTFSCTFAFAEDWDKITHSEEYYFGEATADTEAEADRMALASLVSMIATHVSTEFSELEIASQKGTQEEHESRVKSCVKTYAQSTLTNVHRMKKSGKTPPYTILRYMKRSELQQIYGDRIKKALHMVDIADKALEKCKIDIALQHYYWAYSLVRSLQRPSEVTDHRGALVTWLPARISDIMGDIRVQFDKQEDDYVDLLFTYKDQPVSSLEFSYNDGHKDDCNGTAKDGRGMIELAEGYSPEVYKLNIEYEFKNVARGDGEMQSVLDVIVRKPFTQSVITVGKTSGQQAQKPTDVKPQKTVDNTGVHLKPEKSQVVSDKEYAEIAAKVIEAIRNHRYSDADPHFTFDGLETYRKLISYGTGRIVGTPDLKFFKSAEGAVVARGLQMSFSFTSGKSKKTFVEDVCFTFDKDKKITAVSFGVGNVAANDLLCKHPSWPEETREMILEFLESYKTAYCLKRLDYIRDVFADDAIIIVGNVVKRPAANPSRERPVSLAGQEKIIYNRFTKDEYLKHLERNFMRNEFININFTHNDVQWLEKYKGDKIYAIQIGQEYTSSTYGDKGFLFLLVNMNDPEQPQIKIRTWQPNEVSMEKLYNAGDFYSE